MRPDVRRLLQSKTPPPLWPKPPTRLRDAASAVAVGRWLGPAFGICMLTGMFSQSRAAPDRLVPAADRAGLDLPGQPGPARGDRDRRHPAPDRQALDGLPAVVLLASGPERRRGARAGKHRGPGLRRGVRARDRAPQHPAVVPLAVRLHPGALVGGVAGRSALSSCTWPSRPPSSRRTGVPSRRRQPGEPAGDGEALPAESAGISRRALLVGTGAAAAVVTAVTAGQSLPLLRPLPSWRRAVPAPAARVSPSTAPRPAPGCSTRRSTRPGGWRSWDSDRSACPWPTSRRDGSGPLAPDRLRRGLERHCRLDRSAAARLLDEAGIAPGSTCG